MTLGEIEKRAAQLREDDRMALNKMDAVIAETRRVAAVAHNSEEHVRKIQDEFNRLTGLDRTDYAFLGLATAMQVARWAIIAHFSKLGQGFDPNERMKDNDQKIKDLERKQRDEFKNSRYTKGDEVKQGKYKDWLQILYSGVPFDTSKGTKQFGLGIGGPTHRIKTLGHDPILGWIFGPMNIMTDLMTTNDFISYQVTNGEVVGHASTMKGFYGMYESTMEDKKRLAAAIVAEAIHLESDKFTKIGLPIPLLSSVCEPLAKALSEHHYDNMCFCRDLKTVALQAGFSMIINLIIGLVHGLFFDESKHRDRDLYACKTHKILMYSNIMSSASNLIYTGIKAYATGPSAWKSLDIGGLGVTLYRLIADTKFIYRVQEEFVEKEFNKLIQGDDKWLTMEKHG
ncbi:MAG: hypothetical protein II863_14575 [Kiritimatiellae bacterium]|nr:hypothetical protein [Kiritimatiellia bacterium]